MGRALGEGQAYALRCLALSVFRAESATNLREFPRQALDCSQLELKAGRFGASAFVKFLRMRTESSSRFCALTELIWADTSMGACPRFEVSWARFHAEEHIAPKASLGPSFNSIHFWASHLLRSKLQGPVLLYQPLFLQICSPESQWSFLLSSPLISFLYSSILRRSTLLPLSMNLFSSGCSALHHNYSSLLSSDLKGFIFCCQRTNQHFCNFLKTILFLDF